MGFSIEPIQEPPSRVACRPGARPGAVSTDCVRRRSGPAFDRDQNQFIPEPVLGKWTHVVTIDNPYDEIDWTAVGQYTFAAHIHTSYGSDYGHNGGENPHNVIDFYASEGRIPVDIVAFTDHQRSIDTTVYPWTELSKLDRIPADETYENRDPAEMGMIAIEGLEVEGMDAELDQMGGFNAGDLVRDYDSVQDIFETIDERGGWGWFFHPCEYYDEPGDGWADGYYEKFLDTIPNCIGMEVVNGAMRSPYDENLWDNALTAMAPNDRVIGAAGDDLHSTGATYPMSWNTVLLDPESFDPEDQAGTTAAIQSAITSGRTFFSHANPGDPDAIAPTIEALRIDDAEQRVEVSASHYDSVEWISEGQVITRGNEVDLTDEDVGSYLRVKLEKVWEGMTWSQALLVEEH